MFCVHLIIVDNQYPFCRSTPPSSFYLFLYSRVICVSSSAWCGIYFQNVEFHGNPGQSQPLHDSTLTTNHSKQTPTRSPGNNHCFAFAANSFLLRLLWFGFAFIHSCLPSVFSVHIRLRIYCSAAAVDVVASERATKKEERRKKIRPTTMTTYRHF